MISTARGLTRLSTRREASAGQHTLVRRRPAPRMLAMADLPPTPEGSQHARAGVAGPSTGLENLRGAARLRAVLGAPGTGALLFARTLGSLPVGMVPLGIILLLRAAGRSYALAGLADGAYALGLAAMQPLLGRLIDRAGMGRVLAPLAIVFPAGLVGLDAGRLGRCARRR